MGFLDLVRCATVSLGIAILGCSVNLGGGTTLGGRTTLGDGVSLGGIGFSGIGVWTWSFIFVGRMVAGFLIAGGVGGEMDGVGGVM